MGVYLLSVPFMKAFKELMLGSACVLCKDVSIFIAVLLARKGLLDLRIRLIVISFHKT